MKNHVSRAIIIFLFTFTIAAAIPIKTINENDLGINVTKENTITEQQGTTSTYTHSSNTTLLAQELDEFNTTLERQSEQLYTATQNNTMEPVQVERRLSVYRITTVYDNVNKETYITKKTLAVTPTHNQSMLWIIEDPSEKSYNHTTMFVDNPAMDDHNGYAWFFTNTTAGTEYNVTYYTDTILVGTEGTNVFAYGTAPPTSTKLDATPANEFDPTQLATTFKPFQFNTYTDYILKGSSMLFAVLTLGIFGFELETKGKLRGIKDLYRDLTAILHVGFRNKRLIEDYIQDCIEQGHHPDDIHIQLIRAGWNRTAVRQLIKKY